MAVASKLASVAGFMSVASILCSVTRTAAAQTCPQLLWNDEFEGSSGPINSNYWSFQEGDGCILGDDLCGWGNNELQIYRKENANVKGGRLEIKAEKVGNTYYSARIRTRGKVSVDFTKPRRVEASILTAEGMGIWPAFWMLPADLPDLLWPTGGEIDIMEYIGREPDMVQGYLHYGNTWNDKTVVGGPMFVPDPPYIRFHVFAVEKHSDRIDYYVDNHLYQSYSKNDLKGKFEWPFDRTFYFLLNVAVGGNWPGAPDETTDFPTTMKVDYVRVYDITDGNFGQITGPKLVHVKSSDVIYCLESDNVEYTTMEWFVPEGSSYVEMDNVPCVRVEFGLKSGYVEVVATSACDQRRFSVPVKVQSFYRKKFTFITPGEAGDKATIDSEKTTGFLSLLGTNYYKGRAAIKYKRNGGQLYDNIHMTTSAITDASKYVKDQRRFYMDVYPTTSAKCTEVLIQLEDSNTAISDNYPRGRHSRYRAFIQNKGSGWERLEFSYVDTPDKIVADGAVDRIIILFNPEVWREDTYYFANLDSAVAKNKEGATSEPLSTNQCRARNKSEEGACADGANNDGFGYDGEPDDGPVDCNDSDCYFDPVCNVKPPPPPPPKKCRSRQSKCTTKPQCCGRKSICKKRNLKSRKGRCAICRKKGQPCSIASDCCNYKKTQARCRRQKTEAGSRKTCTE